MKNIQKLLLLMSVLVLLYGATFVFKVRDGIIDHMLSYILYPFIRAQHLIVHPVQQWRLRKRVYDNLFQEYQALYNRERQLLQENSMLHSLLDTERCFDELIDFKQRYKSDYKIPAQIIYKHIDANNHFFYLDKGSKHGIVQDMIVVAYNCLVGRVSEVYPFYSKVILLTDHHSKVPALCVDSHAQGIVEGECDVNELKLSFVSHLEHVVPHDVVISRGEGLVYPKGFLLGRIKTFSKNGLLYDITLEPLVDFSTLENCYIIQRGAEFK